MLKLIITIICVVQTIQQCSNNFVKNDLSTIQSINSTYCMTANLSVGSCCSASLLNQMHTNFLNTTQTLDSLYASQMNHYQNKSQQLINLPNITDQKYQISFAAMFSEVSDEQALSFQQFHDYQSMYTAMNQSMVNTNASWQTCRSLVLQIEAGRQCLLCNPSYLSTQTSSGFINLSLDVCISLMRNCFAYIQDRIELASYVNVINVLQVLSLQPNLSSSLINQTESFQQQNQFATLMSYNQDDLFMMPAQCANQFDCSFICNQYITSTGLNFAKVLNPQSIQYRLSFARILEILTKVQQRRRMLSENVTNATRQLTFYVQDFWTPNGIYYTVNAPNSIPIGQDSGLLADSYRSLRMGFILLLCIISN